MDAVDLAPLGAGDGNPAMETMLVYAGRLYLQLAGEPGSPQPHAIAVIDLASETLVDADPAAPGMQGIALVGTGPRFKMQRVPRSNRLMVSATGAFHDNGGFELIDLDTMDSLGLVVREQEEAGADAGAFTMVDEERGWLVFSTDLLLSSHLHAFTLTGGMDPFEADISLDYFAPHLVYHAASNTLFWPEPDGVQPFDATTGAPRAGSDAARRASHRSRAARAGARGDRQSGVGAVGAGALLAATARLARPRLRLEHALRELLRGRPGLDLGGSGRHHEDPQIVALGVGRNHEEARAVGEKESV